MKQRREVLEGHDTPRQLRHEQREGRVRKSARQVPPAVMFLAFVFVAGIGYVAGTFNTQIFSAIGPLFGFRATYAGSLDLSSVQETYRLLKTNFDGTLDTQALIDGANKGLVEAAGDPYTAYFNAKASEQFNDDLSGDIGGGIGAEIGIRNDQPTIVRVLDDNPAKEAGLLAGDQILKVNDESVDKWTVENTVAKIRGEAGTTVKLEVARAGETKEFTITRALVNNPSVTSSIENGIGIMRVTRFDDGTAALAKVAAQSFKKAGVKSVILDLRNNGGGYLTAAQAMAGLWLDNKLVVTEKTRGAVTEQLKTDRNALLAGIQTVVLVNGSSASASEIVAGALQDYKAATILGEKTYGKGSVQQLINLPNKAQLKVTIARWYTPNGKNINKEGITPDKVVTLSDDDSNAGRDPQLDAAKELLK